MAQQLQLDKCQEHSLPFSILNLGQEERKRIQCNQCEQVEPVISIQQGLEMFDRLSAQAKYIQQYKEDEFYLIEGEFNPIIERQKQNTDLLEELLQKVKDTFVKTNSETEFLIHKSKGTLSNEETEKLANLLMKQKNGFCNSQKQFYNTFDEIYTDIFQKIVDANKVIVDFLNYFKEKTIKFINNLLQEESLLELENFINEEFQQVCLSNNNRNLVASLENSLQTFSIRNHKIKKNQVTTTIHNKITAICFDNENRIYITGEDQKISHWELSENKCILKYKFDSNLEEPINQMIFDQNNRQLITCTRSLIVTWLDKEQKQVLKNNISSVITCIALNKLSSLLLQGGSKLVIWDRRYHGWVSCQIINKKVNAVCFFDESQQQLITLCYDDILLWKLQGQQFVQIQQINAIAGQLIFCQSLQLILCFNKSQCKFFKIEQNKLVYLKRRQGERLNVCAFENGENIIFFNYGQCSILSTKQLLHDS